MKAIAERIPGRKREQRRSRAPSILLPFLNLTGALWLNSPSSPRPRWVVG